MRALLQAPVYSWAALIIGLALSLTFSVELENRLQAESRNQLEFSADQITQRIEERLATFAVMLRGGAGLFDGSEQVTGGEWAR